MKIFPILFLIFLNSQVFASKALYPQHHDRGIYFDKFATGESFWRNCYTTEFNRALERVQNKDHRNFEYLEISNIVTDGDEIKFNFEEHSHTFPASLRPCLFEDADVSKILSCEVTLIEREVFSGGGFDNHITVDKSLRDRFGENAAIIDCKNKKIRRFSNSWKQPMLFHDFKIAKELNKQNLPMQTVGASSGGVVLGGSLNPYRRWSAQVNLPFMDDRMSAELCDNGLLGLSYPGSVENHITNLSGSWCPWGLRISKLKCDLGDEQIEPIEDKLVKMETQFPIASQKLKKYCENL